jgi:hypothetical protein
VGTSCLLHRSATTTGIRACAVRTRLCQEPRARLTAQDLCAESLGASLTHGTSRLCRELGAATLGTEPSSQRTSPAVMTVGALPSNLPRTAAGSSWHRLGSRHRNSLPIALTLCGVHRPYKAYVKISHNYRYAVH